MHFLSGSVKAVNALPTSAGLALIQQAANSLILNAAISLSTEITIKGYLGFLNKTLKFLCFCDIINLYR